MMIKLNIPINKVWLFFTILYLLIGIIADSLEFIALAMGSVYGYWAYWYANINPNKEK